MVGGFIVCGGIYEQEAVNPFSWEPDFPPVYGHTSVAFLKHCPGFKEAKHGDMRAALNVVNMCIKPNRIAELKKKHPGAILIPVVTENKLPEAFARQIGMEVHASVYELEARNRKNLTAMERMLYKPYFCGEINGSADYIIVDDIVTQGGTISALRKHVIFNRGTVVAVTALAFSADSRKIAPDILDVYNLNKKFTYSLLNAALRKYNIADDVWELTRSQVKYLLRFEKIESMIESIVRSKMSCI